MGEGLNYEDEKNIEFNQYIDEQYEEVKVFDETFSPSYILFNLAQEAYRISKTDFDTQQRGQIKQSVFNRFPSCIAYNYRLSEKGEGATDPVRKLLHLKDTWENIAFVLYAIVWGEIRHKSVDLRTCQVFKQLDNGVPRYVPFSRDILLSNALKVKIHCIKAIIDFSNTNSLNLKCEKISIDLLDKLLQLQDIRNSISHHAAPTKEQAEEELMTVIPLFEEMLQKSKFLENCEILRFESFSTKCKCEVFNGHALNKEYDEYSFDTTLSYVLTLGKENIFINWEGEIFSLSPFLHFDKDASGHESYLSFFKGRDSGKYWFEPVKIRSEKSFDNLTLRFDSERDTLINLIIPTQGQ